MPALHRYFGTPLTTSILNILYSTDFSDIHCGMRGITRDALVRLDLESQSWEYASEMVLKAVCLKLKTAEVPVHFLKDPVGRLSHMKRNGWMEPWRAGWINLRAMLLFGADFFLLKPGLMLLALGLLLTVPVAFGPLPLGPITLSLNWMMLGLTLSVVGLQCFYLGCIVQVMYRYSAARAERWLHLFSYDRAMIASGVAGLAGAALGFPLIHEYIAGGLRLPAVSTPADALGGARSALSGGRFPYLRLHSRNSCRGPSAGPSPPALNYSESCAASPMTPQILITGGAGCIGSDLAAALLERGHQVTVLDNLSSGKHEHIANLLPNPNFKFIEGDLLDPAALDAAMQNVEMVYHLAANPDVKFASGDATDKDLRQNTLCTYNVLECMRRQGVRRLAFSSTSAIYGICERQPIAEEQAPHPISLYGATKLSCEAMIGAFQHLFAMDCCVFRFANVVGPKVRKRGRTVIGDFIANLRQDPTRLRILGNGRQAKSYLLAEECVEAMLFAIDHAPPGMHTFNLGCDDSLSVDRIAEMVASAMGLTGVRYEYTGGEGGWLGDVPRFRLDVSAINRLGWRARYNSEEAVALAIEASLGSGSAADRQFQEPVCKP